MFFIILPGEYVLFMFFLCFFYVFYLSARGICFVHEFFYVFGLFLIFLPGEVLLRLLRSVVGGFGTAFVHHGELKQPSARFDHLEPGDRLGSVGGGARGRAQ